VYLSQGQAMAELRVADMVKGAVVDITAGLAMRAALLSATLKIPMADSPILAVTQEHAATLWTQDEHFKNLPGMNYVAPA
jgi:predicted nucleic acid-binding protein